MLSTVLLLALTQTPIDATKPPTADAASAKFWVAPTAIGVATMLAGALSLGVAFQAHDVLTAQTFTTRLSQREATSEATLEATTYIVGWACLGTGAALSILGLVLALKPNAPRVAAIVTPRGASAVWSFTW